MFYRYKEKGRFPFLLVQRGNRRENVFFTEKDRTVYLDLMKGYGGKHRVEISAYCCLMTNHPVRAKRVLKAEEYPGSNAAAHCGLAEDLLLSQRLNWKKQQQQITDRSLVVSCR
jgi:hypothetical protein